MLLPLLPLSCFPQRNEGHAVLHGLLQTSGSQEDAGSPSLLRSGLNIFSKILCHLLHLFRNGRILSTQISMAFSGLDNDQTVVLCLEIKSIFCTTGVIGSTKSMVIRPPTAHAIWSRSPDALSQYLFSANFPIWA